MQLLTNDDAAAQHHARKGFSRRTQLVLVHRKEERSTIR